MTLEIQKFCRRFTDPLKELEERYKLHIKRHPQYPNLVLLKYNQLESPMYLPLVQECRGIILDQDQDWKVVSYPFKKFFNFGEAHAAKIDWNSARVYEKFDGSLMTLYPYDGKWHVASSGTPDASGGVNGFGYSFADLFWAVWEERNMDFPQEQNHCYMFELCTPQNRVVVRHNDRGLLLTGYRSLDTLEEKTVDVGLPSGLQWERAYDIAYYEGGFAGFDTKWVEYYKTKDVKKLLEIVNSRNPVEHEGFIVCDKDFNRVKIKSDAYVALHHLKGNGVPSQKRLMELVLAGEEEEYISYFPEFQDDLRTLRERFRKLSLKLWTTFEEIAYINIGNKKLLNNQSQKEYAMKACQYAFSHILFTLRKQDAQKKEDVEKILKEMDADKLLELMERSGV